MHLLSTCSIFFTVEMGSSKPWGPMSPGTSGDGSSVMMVVHKRGLAGKKQMNQVGFMIIL